MKKNYESPVMTIEGFETTDYIATCYGLKGYYGKAKVIKDTKMTDGHTSRVKYYPYKKSDGMGFVDDGFDYLESDEVYKTSTGWYATDQGLYRMGFGVEEADIIMEWDSKYVYPADGGVYEAVRLTEINKKNCKQYGCSANAS